MASNAPLTIPNGYADVLRTFGDIRKFIRTDGTLSPAWEIQHIVRIVLPAPLMYHVGDREYVQVTRITVHRLLADKLRAVLRKIYDQGLWSEIDPYGGGFVFRKIRGSSDKVSLHSFGIAWDFRPDQNRQGTKGTMHPRVVEIFETAGFMWGGRFKGDRIDPMHVQFARNA